SDYELGLSYLALLPSFKDEKHLMRAMANDAGCSESTIYRRISTAKLPSWIVELYPTPNDIQVSKISWIKSALEDSETAERLKQKASELKKKRDQVFAQEGTLIGPTEILKELRSVVATA